MYIQGLYPKDMDCISKIELYLQGLIVSPKVLNLQRLDCIFKDGLYIQGLYPKDMDCISKVYIPRMNCLSKVYIPRMDCISKVYIPRMDCISKGYIPRMRCISKVYISRMDCIFKVLSAKDGFYLLRMDCTLHINCHTERERNIICPTLQLHSTLFVATEMR